MARELTPAGNDEGQSGMSVKAMLVGIIISIVIGSGSGFCLGYFIGVPQAAATSANEAEAAGTAAAEKEETSAEGKPKAVENEKDGTDDKESEDHKASKNQNVITALDPIVTNLSDPSEIWIRLELVLASELPLEPDLSSQIHQDLLAHVHAMRLSEMAGPSAFIDLKAELLARARQRSEDRVQSLHVKTLLYE